MQYGRLAGGAPIQRYRLDAGSRLAVDVITYGAAITSIEVPDRDGERKNVVLHHDSLDEYITQGGRYGALIGRYANRIANGRFELDGRTYSLPINNGPNSIHGGVTGFDKVVWRVLEADASSVRMAHSSPDGDQGYPGQLEVQVEYRVEGSDLRIEYAAVTDAPTVLNLTNHTYFNLRGAGSGTVADQIVQIRASRYTPVNGSAIPTGEIREVADTPLDFREPRPLGREKYDYNFVLDGGHDGLQLAAMAGDPLSGRILHVLTTEPGLQFYTGDPNGFTMETQHFPDSPNHPAFPTTILRPGEVFRSATIFRFSA